MMLRYATFLLPDLLFGGTTPLAYPPPTSVWLLESGKHGK